VFCRNALLNETIGINGDGSQIRAWTYLEDLVDGVLLTLDNPAAIGKVFNLGNDSTAISTSELAKLVVELADSNSGIEHRPSPPAEVQLRIPDISLARRVLGFDPQVGLAEGIARTLDWLRPVLGVA
jgi:nucleoside-diphosphate-sugar epimerase